MQYPNTNASVQYLTTIQVHLTYSTTSMALDQQIENNGGISCDFIG